MEPTTATPSSSAPAVASRPPLPRPVVWTTLLIAAALPIILLVTLIIVMAATQYNFLNWME